MTKENELVTVLCSLKAIQKDVCSQKIENRTLGMANSIWLCEDSIKNTSGNFEQKTNGIKNVSGLMYVVCFNRCFSVFFLFKT